MSQTEKQIAGNQRRSLRKMREQLLAMASAWVRINGGSRFIVGNAFAYRATDVKQLATVDDPHGPDIEDADILVPCWGSINKVPSHLQDSFDVLMDMLLSAGKPVKHLGLTKGGSPKHPLMLPYSTPLKYVTFDD